MDSCFINIWEKLQKRDEELRVLAVQFFDFCFDGVEKGSVVAIGMIGCKSDKISFMRGYNEMLKQIEPETILCYGTPFKEMCGNIVKIDYWHKRNGVM